ncbi:hypothetical protein M1506_00375 [Patescibacteria group bacterium]|nr:hypothetical protein [Patescibacteria group bacterium]
MKKKTNKNLCRRCEKPVEGWETFCGDCEDVLDKLKRDLRLILERTGFDNLSQL